jgi:site-specific recombinase XerD
MDDWLAAEPFSERTRETYRRHIEAIESSGYSPFEITPAEFSRIAKDRRWSEESQHARLYCLRAFCRWSEKTDAPIMRMRLRRPALRSQRTLTEEQKTLLQTHCLNTPSGRQLALAIELLWVTGIRAHEAVGVLREDLDLSAGTLGIRGKGGSWGQVALTSHLCSLLEAWLKEERRFMSDARTLFVNTHTGQPLTVCGFKVLFRYAAERAGFPASPHDLRRGMAVHLTRKGVPTRIVQRQGRWNDIRMVERYTQALDIQDVRAALEAA